MWQEQSTNAASDHPWREATLDEYRKKLSGQREGLIESENQIELLWYNETTFIFIFKAKSFLRG